MNNDSLINTAKIFSPWYKSITVQLAWFYTLATSLMLILALSFLYWVLANTLEREDESFLVNQAHALSILMQQHPENTKAFQQEIVDGNIGLGNYQYQTYSRILDEMGKTLYETPGMALEIPPSAFIDLSQSDKKAHKWRSAEDKVYRLITIEVAPNATGQPKRKIQMGLDGTAEEALIDEYAGYLAGVLLVGILASAVLGVVATRRGLKPLNDITKASEHIHASQLHARINASQWPQELVALASAFDGMLERLEESFNRLSQFSADLAHELRTPINNLRGESEVALSKPREAEEYREILASSLEEYDRLSRITDSLLFLAKADSTQTDSTHFLYTSLPFAADKEIEKVIDFYEALAAEQNVEVNCVGGAIFSADSILFQRAISNLLSNALRYTPSGGKVTFCIYTVENKGIEIICCDTGVGIAPEHLPKIFDRFYRVNPSRTSHTEGAGLGLAIVKSIMRLHGGEISIQSTPDVGTSIHLIFPTTV